MMTAVIADLICDIRKFNVYTEWAKCYTPVQTAMHDHYDNDSHN